MFFLLNCDFVQNETNIYVFTFKNHCRWYRNRYLYIYFFKCFFSTIENHGNAEIFFFFFSEKLPFSLSNLTKLEIGHTLAIQKKKIFVSDWISVIRPYQYVILRWLNWSDVKFQFLLSCYLFFFIWFSAENESELETSGNDWRKLYARYGKPYIAFTSIEWTHKTVKC